MEMLKIQNVEIDKLKQYKNNPRIIGQDAIDAVAKSIEQFGFKIPMIIDKNYEIVCGHNRYLACKQSGIKEVPCIIADDLTDEQIKAFRLADNKVAEFANWDYELLNAELEELSFCEEVELNFEDFGFAEIEYVEITKDYENEEKRNISKYLKFGTYKIEMTEEESEKLKNLYNEYIEENGISYGFVLKLLGENLC